MDHIEEIARLISEDPNLDLQPMQEFHFTIYLAGEPDFDDVEESISEQEWDDGEAYRGKSGTIYIDFSRVAPTERDAIVSAYNHVREMGFKVAHIET